ncbi:MAG: Slp family lipoprotein [Syntrophaceae bacterium]|nr:Slp family lipoprotein [Syntrophaceae bacterium]
MKKNMRTIARPFLLLFVAVLISGCAHVISKDLRQKMDPSLTFTQILQSPNTYQGKTVLWGGEIIQTLNQKDGSTLIEVFQKPLGWRGEPRETFASEGRFLVIAEKYLDPYLFCKGRRITVAGEIHGEKIKPVGEMDYRYPLVLSKQIYLWKEYYYPPAAYPYELWWSYPWMRFDFYYHRHY